MNWVCANDLHKVHKAMNTVTILVIVISLRIIFFTDIGIWPTTLVVLFAHCSTIKLRNAIVLRCSS